MWWWSRISTISASSTPGTLCACSAWSTRMTRRRLRADEVDARHEADGRPSASTATAGAVVDVLDGVGDVVRARSSGRTVSGSASMTERHGRRQRDHAAGHVAVQRRDDDAPSRARGRARRTSSVGAAPLETHEQRGAELDRARAARRRGRRRRRRRPARSRSATRHVRAPSTHTRPGDLVRPRRPATSPSSTSTIERDGGRRVHEARRLARLADVAARERALGDDADERAVVVDDGHDVAVLARHREARPRGPARRRARPGTPSASRRARAGGCAAGTRGSRRAAALEHPARLRVDLAEADRHVVAWSGPAGSAARRSRSRPRSSPCPGCGGR